MARFGYCQQKLKMERSIALLPKNVIGLDCEFMFCAEVLSLSCVSVSKFVVPTVAGSLGVIYLMRKRLCANLAPIAKWLKQNALPVIIYW